MLFGYNVFIGLKPETTVADVFAAAPVRARRTGTSSGSSVTDDERLGVPERPGRSQRDFAELYQLLPGRPAAAAPRRRRQAAGGVPDRRHRARHPGAALGGRPGRRGHLPRQPGRAGPRLPAVPRLRVDRDHPRGPRRSAATRTSRSSTRCSSRRSAATSPSRSRTTPRRRGHLPRAGRRAAAEPRRRRRPVRPRRPADPAADPAVQGDRRGGYLVFNTRTKAVVRARRHRAGLPAAARGPRDHLPRRLLPGDRRRKTFDTDDGPSWSSSGSSARPTARTCCTSSTPASDGPVRCCCRTT